MKRLILFLFCLPAFGQWTAIQRLGNIYNESETVCNWPYQVTFANSISTITTAHTTTSCTDALTGSTAEPNISGGIAWNALSFTYGTVTFRGALPNSATASWPAIWLLSANCQASSFQVAYAPFGTCPAVSNSAYNEIDMFECGAPGGHWCQLHMFAGGTSPSACSFDVSDTNYHTWVLTWSAASVALTMDGTSTGCSYSSGSSTIAQGPLFLIIQTQMLGTGSSLPAAFKLDYVEVQDASNNIIFYDHFNHMSMLPNSLSSGAF
jgi:hypothetical protein